MRELSHGRCVQRVCCSSWSCTPHVADCLAIDDWARTVIEKRGGYQPAALGPSPTEPPPKRGDSYSSAVPS